MSTYSKYHQLYYYKHRKAIRKRTADWRKKYAKEYYLKHREEICAKKRQRYINAQSAKHQEQLTVI